MLRLVRTRDVRIGETYLVEVPHALPERRYPMPSTEDLQAFAQWWRLQTLTGGRFRLTVTAVDAEAQPPAVEGLRVVDQSIVRVELVDEQLRDLGLPLSSAYYVQGVLYDAVGTVVELPELHTLRVPTRWLHSGDATRPRTHRNLDQLGR